MSEEPKIIVPPQSQQTPGQLVINTNVPMAFTYANGVSIGMSPTDVQMNFSMNNRPTHMVVMPLLIAKALSKALVVALEDYEKRTHTTIPDINETKDLLKKP
jgi:hypothetical protein